MSDVRSTETIAPPSGADESLHSARWPLFVAVFASLLFMSLWHAPIPGVNEPHYLCKAKHYWNPQWCEGDFFLESFPAHVVFYQTVGALTQSFSLPQAAWIGRVLALAVLTAGLTAFLRAILPSKAAVLWTVWCYLLLASIGDFSGEWVVGGVEGKVFSYGLVFGMWAALARRRFRTAGVLAGIAVSFHPLVGLWGVGATVLADLILRLRKRAEVSLCRELTLREFLLSSAFFVACSLPGLIPVVKMLLQTPSNEGHKGTYIQVFYRLRHHLDPTDFATFSYAYYAGLFVIWLLLRRKGSESSLRSAWNVIVPIFTVIALAGVAVGSGPRPAREMVGYAWRMQLLKFYPFRMFDALLPIAAAITLVSTVCCWKICQREQGQADLLPGQYCCKRVGSWTLFGLMLIIAFALPAAGQYQGHMTPARRADYIEACRWIDVHTAEDTLFWLPNENWAFNWFAQRPKFVSTKDCPQNAAGIIEWNRRLNFLFHWAQDHAADGYSREELANLHEETGITHILSRRFGPMLIEPAYRNRSFRVYAIDEL